MEATDNEPKMNPDPQKEHLWLHRLVGEWTYENEMEMGPDNAPQKFTGTESVRSIGGLWVVAEGRGEMPGGGDATVLITLGFEPTTGRFVSTWIGSMMTQLWVCDGELDAAESALTLHAEGPDFDVPGKRRRYRDVIEFQDDDHRTLTAYMQGDDGEWNRMFLSHYWRQK